VVSTPFSDSDIALGLLFGAVLSVIAAIAVRGVPDYWTVMAALILKLIASVVYGLVIIFYYGIGDTIGYHEIGIQYAELLRSGSLDDLQTYLSLDPFWGFAGYSTLRFYSLSGLIHFFTFDSFLASGLVFALIGFWGQVLLYRTFVERYPYSELRPWWKAGILFFPSLTFWSAGMLKDTVGLWGLGVAVWGLHQLAGGRLRTGIALAGVGVYTIFLYRTPLVPVVLVSFAPWILRAGAAAWETHSQKYRQSAQKWLALMLLGAAAAGLLWLLETAYPRYSPARLPQTIVAESGLYETNYDAGSTQDAPIQAEATWAGLVRVWPEAVVLSLLRPFPWEANGLLMWIASVENLILLALAVRAGLQLARNRSAAAAVARAPLFQVCVLFVLLMSLGVGASTPNLGTVSRYRLPMIPFFFGAVVLIEYHARVQPMRRRAASAQSAFVSGEVLRSEGGVSGHSLRNKLG
jgi:hypothetical protein